MHIKGGLYLLIHFDLNSHNFLKQISLTPAIYMVYERGKKERSHFNLVMQLSQVSVVGSW